MLTEAANIIFQYAKRRCYTISKKTKPAIQQDTDEHEDEWEVIREIEGVAAKKKSEWPEGMQPVLEELPKWSLVAAALQEIEEEMIRRETKLTARAFIIIYTPALLLTGRRIGDPGTNTVLIMTSSIRSAQLLKEFLGQMDPDAQAGMQGRQLMEDKLRAYLVRQALKKAMQKKTSGQTGSGAVTPTVVRGDGKVSEALMRKDKEREARAASRRRIRGGAPPSVSRNTGPAETLLVAINQQEEAIMA